MANDKKKPDQEDPARQIIPVAEDEDMLRWLGGLFHLSERKEQPGTPKVEPDSMPERIVLHPVFGPGGIDKGPPIGTSAEWKPMQSPLPANEHLVQLANRFIADAQRDCNANGKKQKYALFAYSTLKGAEPISRYLFERTPKAREFLTDTRAASDDDDTHRDRLLSSALSHNRWLVEQQTEAMSGVMRLQQEIIQQQAATIARQDAERRAWMIAAEEALSKKHEREMATEWHKFKLAGFAEGVQMLKGLVPALSIYLSKGKIGIVEGLKAFIDSLTDEVRSKLFGKWNETGRIEAGILTDEQCSLLDGILNNQIDPKRITEFMSSLQPDQLMQAQQILTPAQIQSLAGLAKAASEVQETNALQ